MNTPISALLERKGSVVHAVAPSMTIAEAVAEMNRHRIGSIVVLEHGRLAGIFTERDVLRRVIAEQRDPQTTSVATVMTLRVATIAPEATVEEAMRTFSEQGCRHLPVVRGQWVYGVLSIGDISRWMADVHRTEAEHLKNYIAGGLPA